MLCTIRLLYPTRTSHCCCTTHACAVLKHTHKDRQAVHQVLGPNQQVYVPALSVVLVTECDWCCRLSKTCLRWSPNLLGALLSGPGGVRPLQKVGMPSTQCAVIRARQGLWISRGRPHRTEICILREFPACSAYVDGGWFKTRSGLTERAETILLKLQYYWLSL